MYFLLKCSKFDNSRKELIDKCYNKNIINADIDRKILWLLSNEDPSVYRRIANFIYNSFSARVAN